MQKTRTGLTAAGFLVEHQAIELRLSLGRNSQLSLTDICK